MLSERSFSIFGMTSLKQHTEYTQFPLYGLRIYGLFAYMDYFSQDKHGPYIRNWVYFNIRCKIQLDMPLNSNNIWPKPNLQQLRVVRPRVGGEPRRPARPLSDASDHRRKGILRKWRNFQSRLYSRFLLYCTGWPIWSRTTFC